jgi:Adenylate and Guanylate cyclase catalytic domain
MGTGWRLRALVAVDAPKGLADLGPSPGSRNRNDWRIIGAMKRHVGAELEVEITAPTTLEFQICSRLPGGLGRSGGGEAACVEVRERDGVGLQLRVGLNSGQVIAGEIGSGPFGYTAVGEQVGMAQRMESVAPPGGVMLSAATARLVEGAATLDDAARFYDGGPVGLAAELRAREKVMATALSGRACASGTPNPRRRRLSGSRTSTSTGTSD